MNTMTLVSRVVRRGRHAALFMLVAVTLFACRAEAPQPAKSPTPPSTAPTEAAIVEPPILVPPDVVAQRIKDARGKPVVVNFWATWCPPCVEEMPELARFYSDFSTRGITFISVSADDPAGVPSGKLAAFARENKLPFPVLVLDGADPEAMSEALNVDLGTLPVTLVYGPEGEVVQKWETGVTAKQLSEAVTPLM